VPQESSVSATRGRWLCRTGTPRCDQRFALKRTQVQTKTPCVTVFQGQHVLIVDDVVKTGGTLATCAVTMKAAGALSISAFCTHAGFPVGAAKRFCRGGDRNVFTHFWLTNSNPGAAASRSWPPSSRSDPARHCPPATSPASAASQPAGTVACFLFALSGGGGGGGATVSVAQVRSLDAAGYVLYTLYGHNHPRAISANQLFSSVTLWLCGGGSSPFVILDLMPLVKRDLQEW
jgi:hypothetical protein